VRSTARQTRTGTRNGVLGTHRYEMRFSTFENSLFKQLRRSPSRFFQSAAARLSQFALLDGGACTYQSHNRRLVAVHGFQFESMCFTWLPNDVRCGLALWHKRSTLLNAPRRPRTLSQDHTWAPRVVHSLSRGQLESPRMLPSVVLVAQRLASLLCYQVRHGLHWAQHTVGACS
jgi:hypothetical protein